MNATKPSGEPVAIIGMACIFPKAPDLKTFWHNIVASVDAIGEPLPEWEADRYLSSGRIQTSRGGFLNDLYRFDPLAFGIMPSSIDGGEPDQFLALRIARDALADAGYLDQRDYDHRDTGIILGHSAYLHRSQANHVQHHIVLDQTIELLQALFPGMNPGQAEAIRNMLAKKLPQCNVDTVTGLVPNVMTGRIANRLNLRGPNYIIDGACASSLLAVSAAMDELRSGRSRLMLAGGINASLPPEAAVIFTQLGALSKRGCIRPFDADGDGTLLGEGAGIVVLKRLPDALADGDRIYALIRGVGTSSDGKALGLLAPNVAGEALAIERAYTAGGIDPASVGMIEAHGTGIPLGDVTEIKSLGSIFKPRDGQAHIALGTVKSMIGHCIPAAGAAGLIKSALALHHRALPPTLCSTVNPDLKLEETPFFINTSHRPWIASGDAPRRAAVNAFGFGGINAHAILEESPEPAAHPPEFTPWPFELFVFSGADKDALLGRLESTTALLSERPGIALCDLAAHLAAQDTYEPFRLAIVAQDAGDLSKKIKESCNQIREKAQAHWATRSGSVFGRTSLDGKVAFMFPGEGSQYLGMFADLILCFPEARKWFDFWRGLYGEAPGESRTDIVFPVDCELSDQRRNALEARLHGMDVGSESVFVASQAMHAMLQTLGVRPDVMIGHSTGESSALAASGAMAYGSWDQLRYFIQELNQAYRHVLGEGGIPTGALVSVGALPLSKVESLLGQYNGDIVIAMDNCANQQVLYGPPEAVGALQRSLTEAGGVCVPLPFDRGYHTAWFSRVSDAFSAYYDKIQLTQPGLPLYSCASAGLFPDDVKGVKALASRQWSVPVRFRETIEKMHADGVRYFVEVGPSGNLCAFVNDILSAKEHVALPTNLRRKNDLQQFLIVLGHLFTYGRDVKIGTLFERRAIKPLASGPSGEQKDRSIPIANTLPVMHIEADDLNLLRQMVPLPERSDNARADGAAHPNPVDIDRLPARAGYEDSVMAGYFDLMNTFLEQQCRVMGHLDNLEDHPLATPFLDTIIEWDEQRIVAACYLNLREDTFLQHHILSGRVTENDPELHGLSCVPLMVSLEIMAEACALLYGSTAVRAVENVKASAWITLDEEEVALEVQAEWLDDDSRIRACLINQTTGDTIAVTADFLFETEWRSGPLPDLLEQREFCWKDQDLYAFGMFHGPVFQSIRRIEGWCEQGIDAALSAVKLQDFFIEGETPAMVLNPVLLDALGQLAAYWIIQQIGTDFNCFPSTIERIELYQPCPHDVDGVTCRARQAPLTPGTTDIGAPRAWQFECLDRESRPLVRVVNLHNVFYAVPHTFYLVRMDPLNGWLGRPEEWLASPDVMIWRLPYLPETFCAQSGGIFLNILAYALLNAEERSRWRALKGSRDHKLRWLFGRACIKEAVRFWVHQQTGRLLYPADVAVAHDHLGAPHVGGWWNGSVTQAPEISLSKNRRLSLVAVTPPGWPVGVDVEHLERFERSDHLEKALIEGALAANERKMLRGYAGDDLNQRVLRMWCAKEAAAKFLGIGLRGTPKNFQVTFLDNDWRQAQVSYDDAMVEVVVDCKEKSIVAIAIP